MDEAYIIGDKINPNELLPLSYDDLIKWTSNHSKGAIENLMYKPLSQIDDPDKETIRYSLRRSIPEPEPIEGEELIREMKSRYLEDKNRKFTPPSRYEPVLQKELQHVKLENKVKPLSANTACIEYPIKEGGLNRFIGNAYRWLDLPEIVTLNQGNLILEDPEAYTPLMDLYYRYQQRKLNQEAINQWAINEFLHCDDLPYLYCKDIPERGNKHRIPNIPQAISSIVSHSISRGAMIFLRRVCRGAFLNRRKELVNVGLYYSGDYKNSTDVLPFDISRNSWKILLEHYQVPPEEREIMLQCVYKLIGPHKIICEEDNTTRSLVTTKWDSYDKKLYKNLYTYCYALDGKWQKQILDYEPLNALVAFFFWIFGVQEYWDQYDRILFNLLNLNPEFCHCLLAKNELTLMGLLDAIRSDTPIWVPIKRILIGRKNYKPKYSKQIHNIGQVAILYETHKQTYDHWQQEYHRGLPYHFISERAVHQCYSISFPTLTLLNLIPFLLLQQSLRTRVGYDILGDDSKVTLTKMREIRKLQREQTMIGYKINYEKSYISKDCVIIGEKIEKAGHICTDFKMKMICPQRKENEWLTMPQAAWIASSTLPPDMRWRIQHVIFNKYRKDYEKLIRNGINICANNYKPLFPINWLGDQNNLFDAMVLDPQSVSSLMAIPSVYKVNLSLKLLRENIKHFAIDPKKVWVIQDDYDPIQQPDWVELNTLAVQIQLLLEDVRYTEYRPYIKPPRKTPHEIIKKFNEIKGQGSYDFELQPHKGKVFSDMKHFLELKRHAIMEDAFYPETPGMAVDGQNVIRHVGNLVQIAKKLIWHYPMYKSFVVTFHKPGRDKVYIQEDRRVYFWETIKDDEALLYLSVNYRYEVYTRDGSLRQQCPNQAPTSKVKQLKRNLQVEMPLQHYNADGGDPYKILDEVLLNKTIHSRHNPQGFHQEEPEL